MILQVGLPQSIPLAAAFTSAPLGAGRFNRPSVGPLVEGRRDCVVYTSTRGNKRGHVILDGGRIVSSQLKVGDTAPGFTAPATRHNPLVLSDLLEDKSVVLAFYPKSFTGG